MQARLNAALRELGRLKAENEDLHAKLAQNSSVEPKDDSLNRRLRALQYELLIEQRAHTTDVAEMAAQLSDAKAKAQSLSITLRAVWSNLVDGYTYSASRSADQKDRAVQLIEEAMDGMDSPRSTKDALLLRASRNDAVDESASLEPPTAFNRDTGAVRRNADPTLNPTVAGHSTNTSHWPTLEPDEEHHRARAQGYLEPAVKLRSLHSTRRISVDAPESDHGPGTTPVPLPFDRESPGAPTVLTRDAHATAAFATQAEGSASHAMQASAARVEGAQARLEEMERDRRHAVERAEALERQLAACKAELDASRSLHSTSRSRVILESPVSSSALNGSLGSDSATFVPANQRHSSLVQSVGPSPYPPRDQSMRMANASRVAVDSRTAGLTGTLLGGARRASLISPALPSPGSSSSAPPMVALSSVRRSIVPSDTQPIRSAVGNRSPSPSVLPLASALATTDDSGYRFSELNQLLSGGSESQHGHPATRGHDHVPLPLSARSRRWSIGSADGAPTPGASFTSRPISRTGGPAFRFPDSGEQSRPLSASVAIGSFASRAHLPAPPSSSHGSAPADARPALHVRSSSRALARLLPAMSTPRFAVLQQEQQTMRRPTDEQKSPVASRPEAALFSSVDARSPLATPGAATPASNGALSSRGDGSGKSPSDSETGDSGDSGGAYGGGRAALEARLARDLAALDAEIEGMHESLSKAARALGGGASGDGSAAAAGNGFSPGVWLSDDEAGESSGAAAAAGLPLDRGLRSPSPLGSTSFASPPRTRTGAGGGNDDANADGDVGYLLASASASASQLLVELDASMGRDAPDVASRGNRVSGETPGPGLTGFTAALTSAWTPTKPGTRVSRHLDSAALDRDRSALLSPDSVA